MGINVSNAIHLFKFDNTKFEIWPCISVFPFDNFVTWPKWWSSRKKSNKIWPINRYESSFRKYPYIFLATSWNLSYEFGNLDKIHSKFGEVTPIFSIKTLCIGWNHVFHAEIWQKFTRKKSNWLAIALFTSMSMILCIWLNFVLFK
jgi:hypothetical protein